ncbi:MAG: serine acetyltransferase [Elusimicrobiaceae bacterium]|nr:serine acetyltransferase [Elusimicrobiaceae bacterium]
MNIFTYDYIRHAKKSDNWFIMLLRILKNHNLRYLYYLRKEQRATSKIKKMFWQYMAQSLGRRYELEMHGQSLGKGILLAHAFNISINKAARLGENCTIFKGASIGSIRSGRKQGAPTIGNRVTICINAMVCGNVKIGDDVLIAANAFVNFDVPSNSLVIGNPGVIHKAENPSKDYL